MAVGVTGAVMVAFAVAFLVALAIMATVVVVAMVVARALVTCSAHGGKSGGVDDRCLCCVGGGQGVWQGEPPVVDVERGCVGGGILVVIFCRDGGGGRRHDSSPIDDISVLIRFYIPQ